MTAQYSLVLVWTPGRQDRSDFEEIKAILLKRAPDIEVFIVGSDLPSSVTARRASKLPSLIVSPFDLRGMPYFSAFTGFRSRRGRVLSGCRYSKWQQLQILSKAGIRVPRSIILTPDMPLDPEFWGDLVVVKPIHGAQGRGVNLMRSRDIIWKDPYSWPRKDPRYGWELLVQQFIDPGPIIESFRVFCILAQPVYAVVNRSLDARLEPEAIGGLVIPIAANQGERAQELVFDEEVLQLGAKAAEAFSNVPALGVDIVRDSSSKRLYVLEVNPGGDVWHISSQFGRGLQRRFNLDYKAQFGAIDIIADALMSATRKLAE